METSHGLAQGFKRAKEYPTDKIISINLSGRGDKDAMEVARLMKAPGFPGEKTS